MLYNPSSRFFFIRQYLNGCVDSPSLMLVLQLIHDMVVIDTNVRQMLKLFDMFWVPPLLFFSLPSHFFYTLLDFALLLVFLHLLRQLFRDISLRFCSFFRLMWVTRFWILSWLRVSNVSLRDRWGTGVLPWYLLRSKVVFLQIPELRVSQSFEVLLIKKLLVVLVHKFYVVKSWVLYHQVIIENL